MLYTAPINRLVYRKKLYIIHNINLNRTINFSSDNNLVTLYNFFLYNVTQFLVILSAYIPYIYKYKI